MKIHSFRDLKVWQKSHDLTLKIYEMTKAFPDDEKFGLCSQLKRSSASICANISEGYTKSTKDFIRYLDIARGSLEETKYHLILSKDLNYCDSHQFESLFDMADQIGRMLYSLRSKL